MEYFFRARGAINKKSQRLTMRMNLLLLLAALVAGTHLVA